MEIAVIVVGLPQRLALLREALDSVHRQTRAPDHLLIGVDYAGIGEVLNMNRLLAAADASSGQDPEALAYAFLHDDDVWTPRHLAVAEEHLEQGHDVIVSECTTTGGRPPLVRRCVQELPSDVDPSFDARDIMRDNWFVPSMVVARASTFGRWTDAEPAPEGSLPGSGTWIDWTNWRRLHLAGARYAFTGLKTVFYRFGEWNEGRSWKA